MKVEKIYIGGWFQRTMLHLTEMYDFLRDGTSHLELNKKQLMDLRNNLDIKEVNYGVDGFEYIEIITNVGINYKIFEDGLIVLNDQHATKETFLDDIDDLARYYENKLSPAINYLFSLGSPVPKELANIKTVYPYFIVLSGASKVDMQALIDRTDKQRYFEYEKDNVDIIRGDKYYFINVNLKDLSNIERYIEEQIFIREFKGQLHRYLGLHRIIWEKIAEVKEKTKVRGKEILEFSSKIDGYAKTIDLVDARINQMSTYLRTREKIAKNDEGLKDFLDVMEYRYETLGDTLAYIQQIWLMTKNYVNSAKNLFSGLENKITQKSVENLTILTSIGVVGTILRSYAAASAPPSITFYGFTYFMILTSVGVVSKIIMKRVSQRSKYKIADKDFEQIE